MDPDHRYICGRVSLHLWFWYQEKKRKLAGASSWSVEMIIDLWDEPIVLIFWDVPLKHRPLSKCQHHLAKKLRFFRTSLTNCCLTSCLVFGRFQSVCWIFWLLSKTCTLAHWAISHDSIFQVLFETESFVILSDDNKVL